MSFVSRRKIQVFVPVLLIGVFMTAITAVSAAFGDCSSGYVFRPNSGIGCMQENCNSIAGAHYSYEGYCVCGSSGSINENPADANKECGYGSDNEACPGCLYACVHLDEECPGSAPVEAVQENEDGAAETTMESAGIQMPVFTSAGNTQEPADTQQSQEAPPETQQSQQSATAPLTSLLAPAEQTAAPTRTCEQECRKLMRGGQYDQVLEASGTPPNCKCVVDNKDRNNRLTQTVQIDGDIRTTYTFDPDTEQLIKKDTISMNAERERIRQLLGYKYDEEQIDRMLSDENINKWFTDKMTNIETNTSKVSLSFWWQHIVAVLDHGYENSADFVDTYRFGRCGDSMQWLEREITNSLGLNGKRDNRSEAVLSLTGESYANTLNHTALIVRPAGYSNIEWADIVSELTAKTRAGGLTEADIKGMDPRLLDAKVLDPYFRRQTNVKDFIKGWSVLKIS